ncbi:MAG: sigma 54-interacting transcriptional regulator [Bdellovibrionota bacterium]
MNRRDSKIGSTQSKRVDVRIVCASHKNMQEAMQEGTFREDLYYRLCVFPLDLPPLRQRIRDIPMLVGNILHAINTRTHSQKTLIVRQ